MTCGIIAVRIARSGFLRPSVSGGNGKGSKRLYAFRDIVALRTARELRDMGIGLQKLRKVVRHLRRLKGLENPVLDLPTVVQEISAEIRRLRGTA